MKIECYQCDKHLFETDLVMIVDIMKHSVDLGFPVLTATRSMEDKKYLANYFCNDKCSNIFIEDNKEKIKIKQWP